MIDANDKVTQVLPLEDMPMKRKRGRPSTGKAMTPAEKQRAYRERQKGLRDQNSSQADGEQNAGQAEELRKTREALEALAERQLQLEKELNGHFRRANKAEARVAELEEELKSRDHNSNSGNALESSLDGEWFFQSKKKGHSKWETESEPLRSRIDGVLWDFKDVKSFVDHMDVAQIGTSHRAIRADGIVYEYRPAKNKSNAQKTVKK